MFGSFSGLFSPDMAIDLGLFNEPASVEI